MRQNSRRRTEDFGKRFIEDIRHTEDPAKPQKEPRLSDLHSLPPPEKTNGRTDAKTAAGAGLQQNSDTVFILSVIMLLMSEKADFMLIFALLYILM